MRTRSRITVLVCVLIGGMGQGVIAPRLPELLADASELALFSGVAASLMYLGMFLASFHFGRWADEGRSHWLLGPGLFLYAITLLALSEFRHPGVIFFIRLLEGVGLAAIFVSADFILGRLTPERDRAKWFAFYGIALSVGLMLGPCIAMLLGTGVSGSLIFLAAVSLALAIGVSRIRVPRAPEGPAHPGGFSKGPLITGVAYGFLEAGLVSILPILAQGEGLLDADSVLILVVLVGGVGAVVWGTLADDRTPGPVNRQLFRAFAAATFVCLCGTVVHPSPHWLIAYCLTFGFFGGGMSPAGFAWLLSETTPDQFGRASAAFLRAYGVGSLAGPLAVGAALQYGGVVGMLGVLTTLACGSLFGLSRVRKT